MENALLDNIDIMKIIASCHKIISRFSQHIGVLVPLGKDFCGLAERLGVDIGFSGRNTFFGMAFEADQLSVQPVSDAWKYSVSTSKGSSMTLSSL
jgi:hypothetical protein